MAQEGHSPVLIFHSPELGWYFSQVTGHRSLFYQYRKYPKHALKLTLGLIRPKQKFWGLMLGFLNV